MMIHPTAIIGENVKLGKNISIGPYCVITGDVEIGDECELKSHVVIEAAGSTKIGKQNKFFPFASIGQITQDKKYQGEKSEVVIGDNNVFREYTTVNGGTQHGQMVTKIGNDCLFMASSHVAHDCTVGNNVVLANCVALAGHVTVDDYAIIGGLSAVHQYTRVGEHAMIGGLTAVVEDVIPYGVVVGERGHLSGLNVVGLKRRGFSKEEMQELRSAYDMIFGVSSDKNFAERIECAKQEFSSSDVAKRMIEFILADSSRSICKPRD